MKRWLMAAGLALVFLLLAASVGLYLQSVTVTDEANFHVESFKYDMVYGVNDVLSDYGFKRFNASVQGLVADLSAGKDLVYNIVVMSPSGDVLYKLNGNYISGLGAVIAGDGTNAWLRDPASGNTYRLQADYDPSLLVGVGSADGVDALKQALGSGGQADTAGSVNAKYENYVFEDQPPSADYTPFYAFFLYDDATKDYMGGTHEDALYSRASGLRDIAAAALAVYWLGLALWVLLDARRLRQKAWLWASLALLANVAGFLVYVLARSQGFCLSPGSPCPSCGAMVRRIWHACPHCGSREAVR